MNAAVLHPSLAPTVSRTRTIAAISIGNALEWFDIVIYGFLAVTIAKLFFPVSDEAVSLLITLGTFGVTFVMRPIGSFVLGSYADRVGRKKALTLSISLMMLGTFIIVVAPTYETIGLAAPILIIVARLIQGFAAGGEYGSATALLAEQEAGRRGFFASWQFASQGVTTLLAAAFGFALNALLTPEQLMGWGWRIPFVFGLLIGPAGLYIRRNLEEGSEFEATAKSTSPIRTTLSTNLGRVFVSLGLIILATILAYTGLFMPTYAVKQLGMPASASFVGTFVIGVLQFALCPYFGGLSDRVGRVKVMTTAAVLLFLGIVPGFIFLVSTPTVASLVIVQALMGIAAAAYWGPISAAMSDLFPTETRGTGLSISYSTGVAIFGGFAPFISAWLIAETGSKIAPAFYVLFGTVMALIALRFARGCGLR
jgi:MHS family proline/betaine transporter-like MFS transporter